MPAFSFLPNAGGCLLRRGMRLALCGIACLCLAVPAGRAQEGEDAVWQPVPVPEPVPAQEAGPAEAAPDAAPPDVAPLPAAPPAAELPVSFEDYPVVRLQSLDKVTARTMTFQARVGATIKFGPLYIKTRACRKPPIAEKPEAAAFLQIWETDPKTVEPHWVFSGWMFASSPALSAMDHPIYDVWVLDCVADPKPAAPDAAPPEPPPAQTAPVQTAPDETPPEPATP